MLCEDGYTVSFQPFEGGLGNLMHHHQTGYPRHPVRGANEVTVRPVEFRRKVIMQPSNMIPQSEPKNLMEKLLQEEQRLQAPRLVPTVEVHPIKICYSVVTHDNLVPPMSPSGSESHDGFVLVSQDEYAVETLHSLMKVAAPEKASSCIRVWSQRIYPIVGARYELVHFEDLEVIDNRNHAENGGAQASVDITRRQITLGEWIGTHTCHESSTTIKVLVEIRKTGTSQWAREAFELENRIRVGDFVDAQDSSGKWYESVVKEVTDDTVTVHYLGWASKWDSTLKRRRHGKAVEGIMQVSLFCLAIYDFLSVVCVKSQYWNFFILQ